MRTKEEIEKKLEEARQEDKKHPNDSLRDGIINALEWVLGLDDSLYV